MADNLSDKRLEEFLRDAPGASREEIAEFRQLIERYFLGELTPDEFKARRLHLGTYGIRGTTSTSRRTTPRRAPAASCIRETEPLTVPHAGAGDSSESQL